MTQTSHPTRPNKKITEKIAQTLARYNKNSYLCTRQKERHSTLTKRHHWRDGRVVDCGGLENR